MKQDVELPFEPPRERGTGRAFIFAVLMHLLLLAFLLYGVHWQNSAPAGVEAEIWSAIPPDTTPRVPTPPPQPVQPAQPAPPDQAEIALEQQRLQRQKEQQAAAQAQAEAQRQAELAAQQKLQQLQQQQARDAAAKLLAQQRQQAAQRQRQEQQREQQQQQQQEAQQQEQQRQAQLKQQQQLAAAQKAAQQQKDLKAKQQAEAEQAAKQAADKARQQRLSALQGAAANNGGVGTTAAGNGTGSGGTSSGYADKVRQRVKPNIVYAGDMTGNPQAVVAVTCAPDGRILSRQLITSSGNPAWDAAVLQAIDRSDPMPRDVDGKTPGKFNIRLRPKDAPGE